MGPCLPGSDQKSGFISEFLVTVRRLRKPEQTGRFSTSQTTRQLMKSIVRRLSYVGQVFLERNEAPGGSVWLRKI